MSRPVRKRRYIPQHTRRGNPQREERFDNVRGMLIILVVIGHFLMPLYQTRFITGIFHAIYIFHMPCFVLVSGYYSKSIYKGGRFRWGKIVQMLWIYFLYENVVNITEGLLAGNIPLFPNYFRESGAPWYVLVMAYYYATVPVFHRITSNSGKVMTVLMLAVGVSFIKYVIHTGSILCLDRALSFLPFFYAGYFINQSNVDRYILWPGKRMVELIAAAILLIVFLTTYDFLMRFNLVIYGADYARYGEAFLPWAWLINTVWYAAAFIISVAFIGIMLNRRMFIITDLGKNTLPIYFIHRPLRDILQYAGFFALINPHSKLNVIVFLGFCFLLTVFLGNPVISSLFKRVRSVFDPLLEKVGAL